MTMSAAVKEAYARAHTSTVQIFAVDLDHYTFPGNIRLVNFEKDLTLDSNQYTAVAMTVNEPEIGTDADSTFSLTIDAIPGYLQPWLSIANKTYTPIATTLRIYAYDLKDDALVDASPMATYNLQTRAAGLDMSTVTIELGYTNTANRAFPSRKYTPTTNPGLT